ncbi:MAG: type IV pilus modification PilV family protein [Bacillota bacterium]
MRERLRRLLRFAMDRGCDQRGLSLVEVLVSILLLVMLITPTLTSIRSALYAGRATQSRSQALGLARARVDQLRALAYDNIALLDNASEETPRYGDDMSGDPALAKFTIETVIDTQIDTVLNPATNDTPALPMLRLVRVTVSCPGCTVQHGDSTRPVTLVSVVRGRVDDEW